MRKLLLALISVFFGAYVHAARVPFYLDEPRVRPQMAQAYTEVQVGRLESGNISGSFLGLRVGAEKKKWDYSLGYMTSWNDAYSNALLSKTANLNTVSAEVYRVFNAFRDHEYLARLKIGGGLSYNTVDLSGPEKADSDKGYVLGIIADYWLTSRISASGMVKGLFFSTDVHRDVYYVTNETLYASGVPIAQVEVLNVRHEDDRVNLNSLLIGLAVKYAF